jgi:hypothetical protein
MEIKANDLKIGNWILNAGGKPILKLTRGLLFTLNQYLFSFRFIFN